MRHLRRAVDQIDSMLAYWDREMRCRFANRAYARWFGVDPDALRGQSIRDLLGPELFALNEPYIRGALAGQAQVFERIVPGPDGVQRHSLATYTPDVQDGVLLGFVAHVTEVTPLKQTEARLKATVESLEAEIQRRQASEERLAETRQGLAVTLASIDAGFIATDREGRVTELNVVAEQVTGWTASEARGCSVWQVFQREGRPPDLVQRNPVEVMIEQGITVDLAQQVVAIARDGATAPVELRAALMHGADGSVRGIAMVFRDMGRVLRAEADARRLAAIVESSRDAIIGKTLDGRITSWNLGAQALFGWRADEAIGQPIQMLIPPDRQHEETAIVARLAQGEPVSAFDTLRLAKDGSLREVSLSISPIRDAAGRIVGASKIARDVTSQRRAEAARRASEARLRFTLESAQIGEWELDLATGRMHRSAWHARCFGLTDAADEWTFETFLARIHPDDRDRVAADFRQALTAGTDMRTECRVVWPDASIHWISAHGSLQHDEGGRAIRMLGIVTDITAQQQAQAARETALRLEAENRRIQEANQLKSQFLANMSHELRTPLNAIIGFADLLRSGAVPPDSPKRVDFLGHIADSGRHLLQLINDVLDLSKVESGRFEFFPEPVDLSRLVRDAVATLQPQAQRKRITIDVEVDGALADVQLDPARLKQVLYNYLSNAIKFSAADGRVTVRAAAEGAAHLRLEVQDDGIGIAERDLPRLFTEFQQLDSGSTKTHAGTGLGLALTRRLVQAQGGSVGVQSRLGEGSIFHIVLNRVHGTDLRSGDVPPDGRLLVIEDDRSVQALVVQTLAAAGFRVDAASDGSQALARTQGSTYDAITLELLLPDRPGLDLLASIRNAGASRGTPVVGVSVSTEPGRAAGFAIANVLAKPIRTEEIGAAMARLRRRDGTRTRVMIIDDEAIALELMRAALEAIDIDSIVMQDPWRAVREIGSHRPDAVILDLMMPGLDGFAVLDALRRMPDVAATPVFVWTSLTLSDQDYADLVRSARAVMSKGGGLYENLVAALRRRAVLP